ncbi:hypothetical protein D3C73_546790 [compost metagenome]
MEAVRQCGSRGILGVADICQRIVPVLLQKCRKLQHLLLQRMLSLRGQPYNMLRAHRLLRFNCRGPCRRFFNHHMAVGAAEAKGIDRRSSGLSFGHRPLLGCGKQIERRLLKFQHRVRSGDIDLRRHDLVLQRHHHFNEACNTRRPQ